MNEKQTVINFDKTEAELYAEMEAPAYEAAEGEHFQLYPLLNGAMIVIKNTTVDEFYAYLKRLTESGYALYTNNCCDGDNYFAQYRKGEHALNIAYTPAESTVRLMVLRFPFREGPYSVLSARTERERPHG